MSDVGQISDGAWFGCTMHDGGTISDEDLNGWSPVDGTELWEHGATISDVDWISGGTWFGCTMLSGVYVQGDLGIPSNEGSIGKIISFSSVGELYTLVEHVSMNDSRDWEEYRYLNTSIIVYCVQKTPKPSVMIYLL